MANALDFPNTPANGDIFTAPNGQKWIWLASGPYWKVYTDNVTVGNSVISVNSISVGNSSVNSSLSATLLVVGGGINANGSVGLDGQVLTSNGSYVYWGNVVTSGGVYMKGGPAVVGTLAEEGQNIFRVNANTINYDTTIATGENAQATGPIAVSSGITLTVQAGARVSIV